MKETVFKCRIIIKETHSKALDQCVVFAIECVCYEQTHGHTVLKCFGVLDK